MKANAPEKIYLQENTTTDLYEEWWPEWFFARAKDTDVEYTRTDAFIEKACAWLEENADMFEAFDSETETYYMDKNAMIEDFKKAMKGE